MPRPILFVLVSALLLFAGLRGAGCAPRTDQGPVAASSSTRLRTPAPPPSSRGLRRDARRFLTAFLAFEVGDPDPRVADRLRVATTPAFRRELFAARPAPAAPSASAELTRLSATGLSRRPARALISGSARRPGGSEEFAFLFERRSGDWLAAGPAE